MGSAEGALKPEARDLASTLASRLNACREILHADCRRQIDDESVRLGIDAVDTRVVGHQRDHDRPKEIAVLGVEDAVR